MLRWPAPKSCRTGQLPYCLSWKKSHRGSRSAADILGETCRFAKVPGTYAERQQMTTPWRVAGTGLLTTLTLLIHSTHNFNRGIRRPFGHRGTVLCLMTDEPSPCLTFSSYRYFFIGARRNLSFRKGSWNLRGTTTNDDSQAVPPSITEQGFVHL